MNLSLEAKARRLHREDMSAEDRDIAEPGIHSLTPSLSYSLLSTNWEQQAIAHFFYHYVSYPKNGGQGYLKFLPDLYTKNPDNEYLKHSLLAASMANLGNISCMQQFQINSLRHYGHALQAVSRALQSPLEEAKIDLLLTAIVLFQKYEVMNLNEKPS
jgi:Fungal specific transcription factor domain